MDALGAAIIGLVAGIIVVLAVEIIDQKIMVDDPVGAISVHGVCGAVGTIMVGLFDVDLGLFYGGGTHLLSVQTLGVFSVMAWVAVTMGIVFFIIKKTIGLRVSPKDEIDGLDISEHNLASSYAGFMFVGMPDIVPESTSLPVTGSVDVDTAVPVYLDKISSKPGAKMSKVEIIMNQNRFEALKTNWTRSRSPA